MKRILFSAQITAKMKHGHLAQSSSVDQSLDSKWPHDQQPHHQGGCHSIIQMEFNECVQDIFSNQSTDLLSFCVSVWVWMCMCVCVCVYSLHSKRCLRPFIWRFPTAENLLQRKSDYDHSSDRFAAITSNRVICYKLFTGISDRCTFYRLLRICLLYLN